MVSTQSTKVLSKDVDLPQDQSGGHQHQLPHRITIQYHQPTEADPSLPAILMLPFWGGTATMFQDVQLRLSESHPSYTTIAVSYPGTGLSPVADEMDSSLDHDIPALAAVVLALLEALRHQDDDGIRMLSSREIIICAHSMSAKVVWEMLRVLTIPETALAITGLLLLAPAPIAPLILPPEIAEQQLSAYDSVESATWTLENILTATGNVERSVVAKLARDCFTMTNGAKKGWIELGMKRDCLMTVEEIAAQLPTKKQDVRVQVLVGQKDQVETVDKVQTETVDVLKGLGFVVDMKAVDGVGHLLPVEAQEDVVAALGKLL